MFECLPNNAFQELSTYTLKNTPSVRNLPLSKTLNLWTALNTNNFLILNQNLSPCLSVH